MRRSRHITSLKRSLLSTLSLALMSSGVLFGANAAKANGDDAYFDLPPEQLLNATVISASKKEEKIGDTAAAVYVITSEDILRSGVTSIPEALRMAPGVQVAAINSHSYAISIRGFNNQLANKLLVLVDGRTVYNPLFSGTYWEAQDLVMEDIDRIEVVRGPGGTMWGANAVNGVINIITKKAKDTQGNLVTFATGYRETGTVTAERGGTFGEDNYYRVYGKYYDREGYEDRNGNSAKDGSDSFRSGFRADWGDNLTLQGDAYRTTATQYAQIPNSAVYLTDDTDLTYQGGNILGRWSKQQDTGTLKVQSYFDYAQRRDPIFLDDKRFTFDIESQYNLTQIGRHDLTFGGGYRYTVDDEKGSTNLSFTPSSRSNNLFNVFAQDKIRIFDNLHFIAGSKFEHNDYSGFEYEPSARLQWRPTEESTVWGAVSRAVRTPSRVELDNHSVVSGLPPLSGVPFPTVLEINSNENFKTEKLVAYEIGYRQQLTEDLSAELTGFYNDYTNLLTYHEGSSSLVFAGAGAPYLLLPVTPINHMKAQMLGFEANADWHVTKNWTLSGAYSYINIATNDEVVVAANDQGLAPHHQIGVRTSLNLTNDWTADMNTYYVGELKTPGINDYVRLDVNLGYRVMDNLRLNLVGQNLLGNHQEFGSSYTNAVEIGRTIFGKVTWHF